MPADSIINRFTRIIFDPGRNRQGGEQALEDADLMIPEIGADVLSDDKGICVFRNIEDGTYSIFAMLPGY